MKKIVKDNSGGVPILFVGFMFLLLLTTFLLMEMGSAYNNSYDAETILQRCCNNAVEKNMLDNYRADHILKLNVQGAKNDFSNYLKSDMPAKYTITVSAITGTDTPPNLTVTGTVKYPTLFSQYGFSDITFNFKVKSNNFRIG